MDMKQIIRYVNHHLGMMIRNSSHTTKFMSVLFVAMYLLSFWRDAIDFIAVTPGSLFPPSFEIWTAFSFCFLELHIWLVILDIIMIIVCGNIIEPLWGSAEMILFFAIVNLGVALSCTITYTILYLLTDDPGYLFRTRINGLIGYIAAIAVVVKQMMPDIVIVKTKIGKLKNHHIPFTLLLISNVFHIVGLTNGTKPAMVFYGIMISWTYLRFYQRHPNALKGDHSENFDFVSLFPRYLQPVISVVANALYNILVHLRICEKVNKYRFVSNSSPIQVVVVPSNSESALAERRKQMALKALTEQLGKSYKQPAIPLPAPVSDLVGVPNVSISTAQLIETNDAQSNVTAS